MGGWSGGVYSRFRNWVTDKANSINPQAALFDQEDDGFAAGLNNCITKDGLNKPSSAMDWNGQSLTGVLNFANTGTISLVNGKATINLAGNLVLAAPTSGTSLSITTAANAGGIQVFGGGTTDQHLVLSGNNAGAQAIMRFDANAAVKAFIGAVGTVGQITGDSGVGDLVIRSQNTTIRFSINSGASSSVTINSSGILQNADSAGNLFPTGFKGCPQNVQAAPYTALLADAAKSIVVTGPGNTVTIPSNASVAYQNGDVLTFINATGSNLSIAITSDTMTLAGTATTGTRTLAANGLATAIKSGSTSWLISGAGLT